MLTSKLLLTGTAIIASTSTGNAAVQLPKSACLGVLGVTGLSAHIALTKVAKAQAGETLVISSAAGQIGHLIGQIGKILGLHVIGDLLKSLLITTYPRCLKITEKVSFNIASEASYVYILSGQKLIKNAKNGEFLKT